MPLPDNLSPEDVAAGIARYQGGPMTHDFGESTKFDVLFQGKRFPPKLITALAALHQTGRLPAASELAGGAESRCFQLLRNAGFRVVPKAGTIPFEVGHPYTRKQIGDWLDIRDDTTKGDWATDYHFHRDREAGIEGWWFLFSVLGDGGAIPGYSNEWIGRTRLKWEGKLTSKLGQSQINSLLSGDHPVLLFARNVQRAAFTYYGVAHVEPGSVVNETPVKVVWTIDSAPDIVSASPNQDRDENVSALEDGQPVPDRNSNDVVPNAGHRREDVLQEVRARRGPPEIRDALLKKFNGRCLISGCDVDDVLEAAQIGPFPGPNDDHAGNGLLLRSDLRTLFDLNLLGIEPETQIVRIRQSARRPPYDALDGLALPATAELSREALLSRWQDFNAGGASFQQSDGALS